MKVTPQKGNAMAGGVGQKANFGELLPPGAVSAAIGFG
jgi:hypothetical protein